MSKRAAPVRSPLRRRLERTIQFAALIFFVALGSAIYQDVSKGVPPATWVSAPGVTGPQSNTAAPSDMRPGEESSGTASAHEPASDKPSPREITPSEKGPSVTAASEPPPVSAPPVETAPREEEPTTTATIRPDGEISLLSPAPLDCERGSPTSWEFANVQLIDSASGRATSLVTSCHVSAVNDGPAACQDAVIVGVGVASSKGVNATESARALRRGINLASALKKDLQSRCTTNVTVSAYVLNLGRYNDEQQRDEPDQRKVIALVATGSNDADKAAADAVVSYAKSDPKIAHYPICELYKLGDAGQPTPVSAQHNNCGEQAASTVSQK
jgi:hypothetical protein